MNGERCSCDRGYQGGICAQAGAGVITIAGRSFGSCPLGCQAQLDAVRPRPCPRSRAIGLRYEQAGAQSRQAHRYRHSSRRGKTLQTHTATAGDSIGNTAGSGALAQACANACAH